MLSTPAISSSDGEETDTTCLATVLETPDIHRIITLESYSTLQRLLRVTAVVERFIRNCRNKSARTVGPLLPIELASARLRWIRAIQYHKYATEITCLQKSIKTTGLINQLGLYLDKENLLRCRGRLANSSLNDEVKFPLLLPKHSPFTELVVLETHARVLHNGVRDTLAELRQTYWIPQGRQLIKRILKGCTLCKKVEGPPFRAVASPPLPLSRMTEGQAFQVTGVDYAGPLFIRGIRKNDPAVKVYISLFTCASVRAVHLEVVENMTTEAFLRAFRRFVSRRGFPERIISDNAKTFKSAAHILQPLLHQIIEAADTQKFLTNNGITWQFIVERAPWWGGFYERMVGLMKRCLKKILGKALLTLIELTTIVTEVEAVLNSRPLTYVYSDIEDGPPLTPSHFLCGRRLITVPFLQTKNLADPDYQPGEDSRQLKTRAKYHDKLMKTFWNSWRKEYLVNLREFHRNSTKQRLAQPVAEGDVVLVHEDLTPRCQWKLACIEKLIPGKDKVVRAAYLRLSNGSHLNRPLKKLYPLEVSENNGQLDIDQKESSEQETHGLTRPLRKAASKALKKIKEQTALLD